MPDESRETVQQRQFQTARLHNFELSKQLLLWDTKFDVENLKLEEEKSNQFRDHKEN